MSIAESNFRMEQHHLTFGTLDAVLAHLDEWGARGVMVYREDLEAWKFERDNLKDELNAVYALEEEDDMLSNVEALNYAIDGNMEEARKVGNVSKLFEIAINYIEALYEIANRPSAWYGESLDDCLEAEEWNLAYNTARDVALNAIKTGTDND